MHKAILNQAVVNSALANISSDFPLTTSEWLLSDFDDFTWNVALESKTILDFRVRLEDDSLLTDEKNSLLLRFFKRFLIAQSNPQFTRGISYANTSAQGRLGPAIHICEYMIVRADELKLGRYGLSALPSSFSHRLLHDVSSSESADAIYQFRVRLTNFLRFVSANLTERAFVLAREEVPSIARSGLCEYLDLSEADLQKARAWLWANDYYQRTEYEGSTRLVVNTSRLSESLYPGGTLRAKWRKPVVDSLVLWHGPLLRREIAGVPVRGVERAESAVRYYVRALRAASWMNGFDPSVPRALIEVVADRQFVRQLPLANVGRYTTVPHGVVLKGLRHAVEFSIEFGPRLLKAYLAVVERAMTTGNTMTMAARYLVENRHLDLMAAGIECWSISIELRKNRRLGFAETSEQIEKAFFREFRRAVGLYEQLQVLWGSILIATGTVMARRQGELLDLIAGDLFDKSRTRLKFQARKRNVGNLREKIMRPAPDLIVRLMTSLEELQSELIRLGLLKNYTQLFSFPRLIEPGLIQCDDGSSNLALDRFCDFFAMPGDGCGRRYYIRQHQLRRFFAMLFFWSNSFSGMETLRWFLGHTDVRHLYHYITESTPGAVLNSVKVDFAIERLREADTSADNLANAINAKLHTTSIQVLDHAELSGVILELLEDGQVVIEPHFFEGHSGQEFTILITTERRRAT